MSNIQNRNPGVADATQQQQQGGTPETMLWQNEQHLAAVLPSHMNVKSFIGTTIGALRSNNVLYSVAQRNPGSLVAALLHAARDGLQPGSAEFYLVPFGNEVTGVRGYQGEIALMYRGGQVGSVIAECVYTKDKFAFVPGRDEVPVHEIDWDEAERGALRLVYAYARMKDGAVSRVVVMGKAEVMRHKAVAKGADKPASPWNKWESSMWLKTAVHELQKWTPKSAEFIIERLRATAAVELEGVRLKALPAAAPAAPQAPSGMKNLDHGQQVDTGTGEVSDAAQQAMEQQRGQQQAMGQTRERSSIAGPSESAPAPWDDPDYSANTNETATNATDH